MKIEQQETHMKRYTITLSLKEIVEIIRTGTEEDLGKFYYVNASSTYWEDKVGLNDNLNQWEIRVHFTNDLIEEEKI